LVDGPAGPTAIARPADADDPNPRRHVVQHLADGLADGMKLAAAAGAGLLIEIDPHIFTGQMRRQAWPIGPRSGCWRPDLLWKRCFNTRDIGVEVFQAEPQLVVVKPLGAPAKLRALQLLNDEAEAFDLRLCFGEVDAFGRKRPHHPMQRLHIVRQGGKIDVHKGRV